MIHSPRSAEVYQFGKLAGYLNEGTDGRWLFVYENDYPITLEPVPVGQMYSKAGLKSIHPRLKHFKVLQHSNEDQLREVRMRSGKDVYPGCTAEIIGCS